MRRFTCLVLLATAATSGPALGYHSSKCWNTYVANSMFGKYEYKYSSWDFISSKTSSEEGFSKVSSLSSTQGSKMSSDPGVTTTGASQSQTEFLSSKGNCSAWAELNREREELVAVNLDALKREIAYGGGELSRALAFLSGCGPQATDAALARLQSSYAALAAVDNVTVSFTAAVDDVLSASCAGQ